MPARSPLFSVILSGGQSARLFPLNKVLSDLSGSGKTLLQQAYARGKRLSGLNHVYVLTSADMVAPMRRQIPVSKQRFLSDPARRGTWPAILWAMAHLRAKAKDPVLAILTGDHVIPAETAFMRLARAAVHMAMSHPAIVLLGVKPSAHSTAWQGFGCFRVGPGGTVTAFEEKPSQDRAETLIREGGWFWNSGMFFFRISTVEAALKRYQPEAAQVYEQLVQRIAAGDQAGARLIYEDFPAQIPHPLNPERHVDNTIDYALITPMVAVRGILAVETPIPRWFDIGRWDALRDLLHRDKKGNVRLGQVKAGPEVHSCILVADKGCRLEVNDLEGCVVACSDGRALVLPVRNLDQIKRLVAGTQLPVVSADMEAWDIRFQKNRLVVTPKREVIRSRS